MASWWWLICLMLLAVRLSATRRFWRLPAQHGTGRFLAVALAADVDAARVARLRRGYRFGLFLPYAPDLVLVPLLLAMDRPWYIMHEQFLAMLLTSAFHSLLVTHFSFRAKQLAPVETAAAPTRVHLSLTTRRLRDHTVWPLEALLVTVILSSLLLLWRQGALASASSSRSVAVWLLYLELGLLLLKRMFVTLRMKLPAQRTEDYVRWRTAWLTYHVRVFDVTRLAWGMALLTLALDVAIERTIHVAVTVAWAVMIVALTMFAVNERRRLKRVEVEVRPTELVRELPPVPIADERFLAGGLFFFNRDRPGMLTRGPKGLAVNLACASWYLWAAYVVGLVLIVACRWS